MTDGSRVFSPSDTASGWLILILQCRLVIVFPIVLFAWFLFSLCLRQPPLAIAMRVGDS